MGIQSPEAKRAREEERKGDRASSGKRTGDISEVISFQIPKSDSDIWFSVSELKKRVCVYGDCVFVL